MKHLFETFLAFVSTLEIGICLFALRLLSYLFQISAHHAFVAQAVIPSDDTCLCFCLSAADMAGRSGGEAEFP